MGEGELKENTRGESRLIYFICRNRKNLKRDQKNRRLVIVRKKV